MSRDSTPNHASRFWKILRSITTIYHCDSPALSTTDHRYFIFKIKLNNNVNTFNINTYWHLLNENMLWMWGLFCQTYADITYDVINLRWLWCRSKMVAMLCAAYRFSSVWTKKTILPELLFMLFLFRYQMNCKLNCVSYLLVRRKQQWLRSTFIDPHPQFNIGSRALLALWDFNSTTACLTVWTEGTYREYWASVLHADRFPLLSRHK